MSKLYCLSFINVFYYLLPIIIGMVTFKHFNYNLKSIFWLICLGFLTDILNIIIGFIFKSNNLYINHLYALVEVSILSLFYFQIFKNPVLKYIVILNLILFLFYSLTCLVKYGLHNPINMKLISVGNFIVVIYCLLYLFNQLEKSNQEILTLSPLFWINSAYLLYFIPTILIYLCYNFLLRNTNDFLNLIHNIVNSVLCILFNTLVTIGFLKTKVFKKLK